MANGFTWRGPRIFISYIEAGRRGADLICVHVHSSGSGSFSSNNFSHWFICLGSSSQPNKGKANTKASAVWQSTIRVIDGAFRIITLSVTRSMKPCREVAILITWSITCLRQTRCTYTACMYNLRDRLSSSLELTTIHWHSRSASYPTPVAETHVARRGHMYLALYQLS